MLFLIINILLTSSFFLELCSAGNEIEFIPRQSKLSLAPTIYIDL